MCVLDSLTDNIDKATSLQPIAINFALVKFDAHHSKWINHSVTGLAGMKTLKFSISQVSEEAGEENHQAKQSEMKSPRKMTKKIKAR